MKTMSKIYSMLFALIAIIELTGFITGHGLHCLVAAIFTGSFSLFMYYQSKRKPLKSR
jgi:hypothetical protein